MATIKAIDKTSVHKITSGQVVIDLQTAVKELIENSIDAGATNVEVRFKNYGLQSLEVVDDGSGIAESDYSTIALKHHTSKLEKYSDLEAVATFGFRGEALSSLCALSEKVTVCTATTATSPMGALLEMDRHGNISKQSVVARPRGTTIAVAGLFVPLPVRRKELERNAKREFAKALTLLSAYALGPCASAPGVRLSVSNQPEKGQKHVQIRTLGTPSPRASVTALWGSKALEHIVDMELNFQVEPERSALKRLESQETTPIPIKVKGLVSKFVVGCGRSGTDRQFFFINGRPCNMSKVQKTFNEVYRSFNAAQSPFVLADFILPTASYDVNVSPDKRTILVHHEGNLVSGLKAALESHFAPSRSTFDINAGTQSKLNHYTRISSIKTPPSPLNSKISVNSNTEDPPGAAETSASDEPTAPLLPPLPDIVEEGAPQNKSALPTRNSESPGTRDMDVDALDDPSISLDTSQTSWGRRLASNSSSSPTRPNAPLGNSDRDETIDETELVPSRKKRRSNAGLAILERDSDPSSQEGISADLPPRLSPPPPPRESHKSKGPGDPRHELSARKPAAQSSRKIHQTSLSGFVRSGGKTTIRGRAGVSDDEMGDSEGVEETQRPPSDSREEQGGISSHKGGPDSVASQPENLSSQTDIPVDLAQEDNDGFSFLLDEALESSTSIPSIISHKDSVPHPEIIRSENGGMDVILKCDPGRIRRVWQLRSSQPRIAEMSNQNELSLETDLDAAGVCNMEDVGKATEALSRVIEKSDFGQMEVVGQFNLGFVLARRRKKMGGAGATATDVLGKDSNDVTDDLFIIDQHAADEKYNFETLQATTKIQSQRLYRPRPLELTAADELLAIESMDVLKRNGFEIDVSEAVESEQGERLKLTALPISKGTVFDVKDLEEIIHLLRDRPSYHMVRCSKARAMFAMRACRKSVMIGMPLNRQQMTTVIRHMGTMDQPWNCPHGRPTMRHLLDLKSAGSLNILGPPREVNWSSLLAI